MQTTKQKIHAQALAEVNVILEYTDKNLVNKIPKRFIEYIIEHKDRDYEVQISNNIPLKNQNVKDETKSIMALIYRNYFCTEEEKNLYDERLNQNQQQYEKVLNEKYSYENLFKNNITKEEVMPEQISYNYTIAYKKGKLYKVKNRLKRFLIKLKEKLNNIFK